MSWSGVVLPLSSGNQSFDLVVDLELVGDELRVGHSVTYPNDPSVVLMEKSICPSLPVRKKVEDYATIPARSGAFARDPVQLFVTEYPEGITLNQPPLTVFNATTQLTCYGTEAGESVLFMQTDDELGHLKSFSYRGEQPASSPERFTVDFLHYPEQVLGSNATDVTYAPDYSVRLAILAGDWEDATLRYRDWARQSALVANGTILDRADGFVAEAEFFLTGAGCGNSGDPITGSCICSNETYDPCAPETTWLSSWLWKQHLGRTVDNPSLAFWRMFNVAPNEALPFLDPALPVDPAYFQAIGTARTVGHYVAPYWLPGKLVPGAHPNLQPFAAQLIDGTDIVFSTGFSHTPMYHPDVRIAHLFEIAQQNSASAGAPGGAEFAGVYYDAISGDGYQDWNPNLAPDGPNGGTNRTDGLKQLFDETRLVVDAEPNIAGKQSFGMTEHGSEVWVDDSELQAWFLIGQQQVAQIFSHWSAVPQYQMIYQPYCWMVPFGGMCVFEDSPIVAEQLEAAYYLYAVYCDAGSIPTVSASSGEPFFPDASCNVPDAAAFYDFVSEILKNQISVRDYLLHGDRLQSPEVMGIKHVDKSTAFSSFSNVIAQYETGSAAGTASVLASVWRHPVNDEVLVVLTHWTADAPPPFSTTIDFAEYGLGTGTRDLLEWTGGGFIPLASGLSNAVTISAASVGPLPGRSQRIFLIR